MAAISAEARSRIMSAIRKRDTKPELAVRRFLHANGFRYRLHASSLPGCPDLIFPSLRSVLFVHGCFWHRCPYCAAGKKEVRSNTRYWIPKLQNNQARDARVRTELEEAGWSVLTVWECEVRERHTLQRLVKKLRSRRPRRYPRVS